MSEGQGDAMLPGFEFEVAATKERYTATTWISNNREKCELLLDLYFNRNCSRRSIAKTLGVSREIVTVVLNAFRRRADNDGAAFFVNSLPLAKKLKQLIPSLDDYIDEKIRQGLETESLSLGEAITLREKILPNSRDEDCQPRQSESPSEVIDYEAFVNGLVGGEKERNEGK